MASHRKMGVQSSEDNTQTKDLVWCSDWLALAGVTSSNRAGQMGTYRKFVFTYRILS